MYKASSPVNGIKPYTVGYGLLKSRKICKKKSSKYSYSLLKESKKHFILHISEFRCTSFFPKPLTLCISMIFLSFSQRHILCTVVCHHCQKRMKLSSILFSSQCGQGSRFQTLLTKNYDRESYFIVTSTSGKGEGVFTC